MADPAYYTPPQLAERWQVDPATVLGMIRRGSLRAFTTSPPGTKRPRWRISAEAVAEYERLHAAQPPSKSVRTSRRRPDPTYTEYV